MKPKEISCDVLVVGAGLSGLAAAVAASEKGARTVLLEKNGFLGGTVIAGMHRYLCGLYGTAAPSVLNGGIARRFISGLKKLGAGNRLLRLGKVHVFVFRDRDLKAYLRALVRNRKNLALILNSRAYSVKQKRGLIQEVRSKGETRVFAIRPKVVVDASGEGVIIKLSKAKYSVAPYGKRQLAGFSFRLKGLKDAQALLPIKVPYYIKRATYSPLDTRGEGLIRMNIPAARGVAGMRREARKALRCLRKVLPEFKDAYIVEFSPSIAEREGLRLQGEYTLTAGDILRERRFKDGVVKNSWPIELWDPKRGTQYRYLRPGGYYEIPLRCLKSKNIKNLLAAGRCISVSREALGSTRVAGACIALGEQAGIAAKVYAHLTDKTIS